MLRWLDLSFDNPAQNLACDEALLEWAELENPGHGLLRFWESGKPFVVVGYAGKVQDEVHLDLCAASGIPIFRRVTGGGSVLQGPGCWNYSLILPATFDPHLETVSGSNRWIMERNRLALESLLRRPVHFRGSSDLALDDLKISGNAQRRKKRWLLFHGTLLRDLDIPLIERSLAMPPREPAYRLGRSHADFLLNTAAAGASLRDALSQEWKASAEFDRVPFHRVEILARERYGDPAWNLRL